MQIFTVCNRLPVDVSKQYISHYFRHHFRLNRNFHFKISSSFYDPTDTIEVFRNEILGAYSCSDEMLLLKCQISAHLKLHVITYRYELFIGLFSNCHTRIGSLPL